MLSLVGVMSIMMGLIAEILMRTYFELPGLPAYDVRDRLNFEDEAHGEAQECAALPVSWVPVAGAISKA